MHVSSVRVYPVKSFRGFDLESAVVEPWGIEHDRRWMVLDPDGENVTARTDHSMLQIVPDVMPDGLRLAAPGMPTLSVARPVGGHLVRTGLSRIEEVTDAGEEAAGWLSAFLGHPVRLVWQDDPRRREVGAKHGGGSADVMSLADAGPLLLTTTTSLQQLNDWVAQTAAERGEPQPEPLVMNRFRPNVVVEGVPEPFVEDGWKRIAIGDLVLRGSELCDRCVMTTLDPDTLAKGKEPIRTLARHRRWDGAVWFGVRLIPESTGTIRAEDPVTVLD